MVKIVLDAGHGGSDPGAIGNEVSEKSICLALVKRIEKILRENYENVEVMLTRSSDVYLTLSERTNKANAWGADAFISIHCNAHTQNTARGFESYVYTNPGPDTIAFQNVIHVEIMNQIKGTNGIVDKGKKQANFHVLRETNMKAILTENLFVSNAADAALLRSESFLDKLAIGHVLGLEKFFGLKKVAPATEPIAMYQIICGTFSSIANAEKRMQELEKLGYKSYIQKKD